MDVLNRLLAIHYRSFPMYVSNARPWTHGGDEKIVETLRHIVVDQQAMAQRISAQIIEQGAAIHGGRFPMDYTDSHDLSIDFLIRRAVAYQRQDIAAIDQCAQELRLATHAKSLADEALGMAKGHLESLEELTNSTAPAQRDHRQ